MNRKKCEFSFIYMCICVMMYSLKVMIIMLLHSRSKLSPLIPIFNIVDLLLLFSQFFWSRVFHINLYTLILFCLIAYSHLHFDNYPLLHHHARNISKSVIAIISYASFWIQLEQLKLHNKQKTSMKFQIKRLTFVFFTRRTQGSLFESLTESLSTQLAMMKKGKRLTS